MASIDFYAYIFYQIHAFSVNNKFRFNNITLLRPLILEQQAAPLLGREREMSAGPNDNHSTKKNGTTCFDDFYEKFKLNFFFDLS